MTSAQLQLWEPALPAIRGTVDHGIAQTLLQLEARCAINVMQGYYWLVDVAPILLRYQAEQWWRDAKREIRYLASDLMEILG